MPLGLIEKVKRVFHGGGKTLHGECIDYIVKHYRETPAKRLRPFTLPEGAVLSTVTQGLGDTLMLTDLPKAAHQQNQNHTCFSVSPHFKPLMKFNPHWKEQDEKPHFVNAPDLVRYCDVGNGHYIQRIRRAFGLAVDLIPRGSVTLTTARHRNRVILHFDPGAHAHWQRKELHPRARMLYRETQNELEKFIAESNNYQFFEVGDKPLGIKGSHYVPTHNLEELVKTIAQASWFIGILSGPLHLATALELKCVVVMNLPAPDKIVLPCLKVTGEIESEWAYPQNCHLHQEGESLLVKQTTAKNFHKAFNGEIYPFWSRQFAPLIEEKL